MCILIYIYIYKSRAIVAFGVDPAAEGEETEKVRIYIIVYIYMYIYMCVYIYICIYIYICMYIYI